MYVQVQLYVHIDERDQSIVKLVLLVSLGLLASGGAEFLFDLSLSSLLFYSLLSVQPKLTSIARQYTHVCEQAT